MRKVGVLLILIGMLFIGLGSGLPDNVVSVGGVLHIMDCTTINETASYVLNASISAGAGNDCLLVQVDNVTIDGRGFTITGNVNANGVGDGANASSNLTINNMTIVGNVSLVGYATDAELIIGGGNGGNITILNSNMSDINTDGGYGGGFGGDVSISNSDVQKIFARGGEGDGTGGNNHDGGDSGEVIIVNSIAGDIDASAKSTAGFLGCGVGGAISIESSGVGNVVSMGGNAEDGLNACNGGAITINNSTTGYIYSSGGVAEIGGNGGAITISNNSITGMIVANGGAGNANYGGNGGVVTIINSTVTSVNTTGGFSVINAASGGDGGNVFINYSNVSNVFALGGNSDNDTCGSGGSVVIYGSNITRIVATGGSFSAYDGEEYNGGDGGDISFFDSTPSLQNMQINISGGGSGTEHNGSSGTLNFTNSGFYNSYGKIVFGFVSTNQTDFAKILNISNNFAYINNTNYVDYNKSSNVTLYNLPTNMNNPYISKDGAVCLDCYNFTSLNAGNVTFNVTSWSTYNISYAELSVDPVVYLFPIANSTSLSRTIYYNVSDDSIISSCSIYFEGVWHHYNESIINKSANMSNNFMWDQFAVGNHIIMVSCEDVYGNIGNSSNVTFSVTQETIADDSSSGSGGGSTTYTILQTLLESGFSRNVGKNYVLKFSYANQTHTITFNNLSSDSITFTVASTPQTFSLKINESVLVDIEKDGVYDLNVTYNKYSGTMANVSLKSVSVAYTNAEESEEIEEDKTVVEDFIEETSGSLWKFVFNLIVLVAIIVLVIILSRRLGRHIKRRKR